MVQNLPAMREIKIQPLSQEGPLKKGMASHSIILTWRVSGAWWATVPGVSKSQTRLKRFSMHACMQQFGVV